MKPSEYMQLAVTLALKGKGYTKTNPCVGAVVVKKGKIIGRGWHACYGGPHAEVMALGEAGGEASGSDIYVTLEPCTTYGKTPPCAKALIEAGIKRVFIGVLDPHPSHAGNALKVLMDAGIQVFWGIEAESCAALIEDFTKYTTTGFPYVTLKTAQTLDGRTATLTGDSQWITGEEARTGVHRLRLQSDGVVTGMGTVLADDPLLTVRHIETDRQPARIVIGHKTLLPVTAALVRSAKEGLARTVLFITDTPDTHGMDILEKNGVEIIWVPAGEEGADINTVLKKLGQMGMMNVLLEAGGRLNASFLNGGHVDALHWFMAPLILGGENARPAVAGFDREYMKDALPVKNLSCRMVGADLWIQGKLKDYTGDVLRLTRNFRCSEEK